MTDLVPAQTPPPLPGRPGLFADPGIWLLLLAACSLVGLLSPVAAVEPLALDEHVSYWMLDSVAPSSLWTRCLEYGAVPPLGSELQWVSIALLGKSAWALRLPSLLAAGLAVLVSYQVGRQLNGSLTGGVAACLLAWHPDVLDEVRIGRCYGLVLLLSACLVLATLRWKEHLGSLSRCVLWASIAVALLWSHYMAAPLVVICWLWLGGCLLRSPAGRLTSLVFLVASTLVGLGSMPLWSAIFRLRDWSPYLNMLSPETPVWRTVSSFWWLALPLGGIVAAVLGRWDFKAPATVKSASPLNSNSSWMLLACSLLPLLLIAFWAVGDLSSLASPRYRVTYAPAGVIWGSLWLTRTGTWRAATASLMVTICAAWALQPLAPWQLGRLGAPADKNWLELNRSLAAHVSPGDLILVQSGLVEASLVPAMLSDALFLEYAACRAGRFYVPTSNTRCGLPLFWSEQTLHDYQELLHRNQAKTIWIACATDTDLNRNSLAGIQSLTRKLGYQVQSEETWPHAVLIRLSHE